MKYDSQIAELKNILPSAKNILIAVPAGVDIDKLAAGLALFLTFEASGKQVSIVCDDNILVAQAHLFGIDHIQKNLPSTEGGNLTLTLEGVAASDNTVPALEKLDWYAENSNLNLVFHVLPGQTFQPARIIPRYQGSGFNLIFTVGATNLNALGSVYSQNQNAFSGTHVVNIDNQVTNTSFGQTNVVDLSASAVSEVVSSLISDLGFRLDADTASNILAGIFDATNNLQDPKVSADTYVVVADCLRAGGKKPAEGLQGNVSPAVEPGQSETVTIPQQPAYDWNAVSAAIGRNVPVMQTTTPQDSSEPTVAQGDQNQASPEERPFEEGVVSETVEPEWLTPKIFKGSSLG